MAEQHERRRPSFAGWMGSMWLYSILRFGLFFALWGLLVLAGLHGLLSAFVALLLSVPLSFVLLAVPRRRFAAQVEQRMNARRADREQLDADLDAEPDPESRDRGRDDGPA